MDCDSRIALVGPNGACHAESAVSSCSLTPLPGAGKSTLLKLMIGDLSATEGTVTRHPHLNIGRYYQHSADLLDENATVLEFFKATYPNTLTFVRDEEGWRSFLGRYGVSGKMQSTKIGQLSEGQKSRLVIATMCMSHPNLLLLGALLLQRSLQQSVANAVALTADEPTNHLDLEAIDGLAEAINRYDGGLVLVSHDFRLIDAVAKEIWVCDEKKVSVWKGDIRSYKRELAKKMGINNI